jgi:arsenate reductase-like glutaredoxin family protein
MDAHGIKVSEKVPASRKLQREDAREILASSERVVVAMRNNVESFDTAGAEDDAVLDRFLGTTGNLRAPTARAGKVTLVGFNEEAWQQALL